MASNSPATAQRAVRVTGPGVERAFEGAFTIGRDEAADLPLVGEPRVSRRHAEVRPERGGWWLVDLGSSNGTYVGGERVERVRIEGVVEARLGDGGPTLQFDVPVPRPAAPEPAEARAAPSDATVFVSPPLRYPDRPAEGATRPGEALSAGAPPAGALPGSAPADGGPAAPEGGGGRPGGELSMEEVVAHYFNAGSGGPAGERTQFIRRAYAEVQKGQRRRYGAVVAAVVAVCVASLGYAGWQQYNNEKARESAQDLFYALREIDVELAQLRERVERVEPVNPAAAEANRGDLEALAAKRAEVARTYEGLVEDLGVYSGLSSEEEAIYRVARTFNESELTIPPEFVREVKTYVDRWKNSSRFQLAVREAQQKGYVPVVVDAMRRHGLPPEFFYLALQESNFNTCAVGPPTRWGTAKGAWQFIPSTGERYGLEPGPLVNSSDKSVCDPLDERHDFAQSADAAARYLRDIYTHLAAASGLLVMASYNWGEGRVKSGLNRLPPGDRRAAAAMEGIANTPRERNYWAFLTAHRGRMPDETKGYVMNIFAAAVIGQDPRLFGIDMDNPLRSATMPAGEDGRAADQPRRLGRDAVRERRARPAP